MRFKFKMLLIVALFAGCASQNKGQRGIAVITAQKKMPIYAKLDEWQPEKVNYQSEKKNFRTLFSQHLSYLQVVHSMTFDLDKWLEKKSKEKKPFDMTKERAYRRLLLAREEHDRISDQVRFVYAKMVMENESAALNELQSLLKTEKSRMPVGVHDMAILLQEVNELLVASKVDHAQPMNDFILKTDAEFEAAQEVKLPEEINHSKEDLTKQLDERLNNREPNADLFSPSTGPAGNVNGYSFNRGEWAITLDDGPSEYTPQFLSLLREDEHFTFFWLSKLITKFPLTVRQAQEMGNELACHSYSHPNLARLKPAGLNKEIDEAREIFKTVVGQYPTMFRCPYGLCGSEGRRRIAGFKMIHIMWNVDSLDWVDRNSASIYLRVLRQMQAQNHGVILFHDIKPQSIFAVKMTLDYIRANGKLVTVAGKIHEGDPNFTSP